MPLPDRHQPVVLRGYGRGLIQGENEPVVIDEVDSPQGRHKIVSLWGGKHRGLLFTYNEPTYRTPSPAQVLRSCLIQLGLVCYPTAPGLGVDSKPIPCFVGSMPDADDSAMCLYDGMGLSFGRRARDGKMNIHSGVRVVIRTPDYFGFDFANQIAAKIDSGMAPIVTQLPEDGSQHWVQNVSRTTGVISMGEELNKLRQLWTFNVRVVFQDNEPSIG